MPAKALPRKVLLKDRRSFGTSVTAVTEGSADAANVVSSSRAQSSGVFMAPQYRRSAAAEYLVDGRGEQRPDAELDRIVDGVHHFVEHAQAAARRRIAQHHQLHVPRQQVGVAL